MSVTQYDAITAYAAAGISSTTKLTCTKRRQLVEITQKTNKTGQDVVYPSASQFIDAVDEYENDALVLRVSQGPKENQWERRLEINSEVICSSLKTVLRDQWTLNVDSCPIHIHEPYEELFHFRDEIRAYTEATERTDEEKTLLGLLVHDFMAKQLSIYELEHRKSTSQGKSSFKNLWMAYRPDELVIVKRGKYEECCRVLATEHRKAEWGREKEDFLLELYYLDFDGERFGPAKTKVKIKPYPGTQDMMQLPVVPLRVFADDEQQKRRRTFVDRGRLWRERVIHAKGDYNGIMWHFKDDLEDRFGKRGQWIKRKIKNLAAVSQEGRVISDCAAFNRADPMLASELASDDSPVDDTETSDSNKPARFNFSTRSVGADAEFTDDMCLLAPARVRGYCITSKMWGLFHVDRFLPIQWKKHHFGKLAVDNSKKDVVLGLVSTHKSAKGAKLDPIADKGNGLIFLLHGSPGVGKTLLAEAVAEMSEKFLYRISTGELGRNSDMIQSRLRRHFRQAHEFGCVLLLDEAEVFLAQRKLGDLQRNELVSIFLQHLEYFPGIVFLTTNVAADFDFAFRSRIHYEIEFPELTPQQRTTIWRNQIRDTPELFNSTQIADNDGQLPAPWEEVCERLGQDLHLNGREISNLMRTSKLFAEYRSCEVTEDILRKCCTPRASGWTAPTNKSPMTKHADRQRVFSINDPDDESDDY